MPLYGNLSSHTVLALHCCVIVDSEAITLKAASGMCVRENLPVDMGVFM